MKESYKLCVWVSLLSDNEYLFLIVNNNNNKKTKLYNFHIDCDVKNFGDG